MGIRRAKPHLRSGDVWRKGTEEREIVGLPVLMQPWVTFRKPGETDPDSLQWVPLTEWRKWVRGAKPFRSVKAKRRLDAPPNPPAR